MSSQKKQYPIIAGIIGQGMNFAFIESAQEWITQANNRNHPMVAINLEAANFNRFPLTAAGKAIDAISEYPGRALTEKEAAANYLFLLYNWTMKKAYGHKAQLISNTGQLDRIAKQYGHPGQKLADQLLERSAQLAAIEITGILLHLKQTSGVAPIVMGGTLFWHGLKYKERVSKWIKIILPNISPHFIELENSDLIGAAILALQQKKRETQ